MGITNGDAFNDLIERYNNWEDYDWSNFGSTDTCSLCKAVEIDGKVNCKLCVLGPARYACVHGDCSDSFDMMLEATEKDTLTQDIIDRRKNDLLNLRK